ncbi:hypothetical protein FDO65_07010 [Nakamurella flava]|uniref:Uncharacterized protein n=1 Tax=Nakamurella flava TaxID=2576308 RepID=A0A4U6QLV3_9ACTN|nr:hypothetical protein [Nakamurella flava]TKV61341.1 hypothetical protein FDO65_07010 [Nakamurella flava]
MTPQERRAMLARVIACEIAFQSHDRAAVDNYLLDLKSTVSDKAWPALSIEVIRQLTLQVVKPLLHRDDAAGGQFRRQLEIAAAQGRAATKTDHE